MSRKRKQNIIINMQEVMLNQRKFSSSEIGRGIGCHENKKYSRKQKHKSRADSLTE